MGTTTSPSFIKIRMKKKVLLIAHFLFSLFTYFLIHLFLLIHFYMNWPIVHMWEWLVVKLERVYAVLKVDGRRWILLDIGFILRQNFQKSFKKPKLYTFVKCKKSSKNTSKIFLRFNIIFNGLYYLHLDR